MENMRLLQRHALRQLFETRPLTRRAFNNSSSFRRGPVQQQPRSVARTIHTQRYGISQQTSSSCLRRRCVGGRRIPTNGTRSTNGSSRRYNSGTATSPEKENLSIKDRLKKLSREYGWSAVGVYLALSALDFPFCFLAVRTLGTDRIGRWEHAIVDTVKGWVKAPFSTAEGVKEGIDGVGDVVERDVLAPDGSAPGKRLLEEETATQQQALDDHGYRAAEKANSGDNASTFFSDPYIQSLCSSPSSYLPRREVYV